MPGSHEPRSDAAHIQRFAMCNAIVLAVALAVRFAPSPYAPRVNVKWAGDLRAAERLYLERRFKLFEPARHEGQTWSYDLGDPSPERIRELIAHPAVADTHHINRSTGEVSPHAPRGTRLVRRDITARWRDSRAIYWLCLFSASSVLASCIWLLSTRSHRQAANDLA